MPTSTPCRSPLAAWAVPGLVAVALFAATPNVGATFATGASAAGAISSDTLQPGSGLTAATSCGPPLSLTATANLTWTATPSSFAQGYTVERWLANALQSTVTVTPSTTTNLTQTGLAAGKTYKWKLTAYVNSWTSTTILTTAATPPVCT